MTMSVGVITALVEARAGDTVTARPTVAFTEGVARLLLPGRLPPPRSQNPWRAHEVPAVSPPHVEAQPVTQVRTWVEVGSQPAAAVVVVVVAGMWMTGAALTTAASRSTRWRARGDCTTMCGNMAVVQRPVVVYQWVQL